MAYHLWPRGRAAAWPRKRENRESQLRGLVNVLAKEAGLRAEEFAGGGPPTNHGGRAMAEKIIPMTRFLDYLATAKEIQRALGARGPAAADLRPVVAGLADLAVKALEEVHQSIEGLAALVMALHPEVTRTRRERNV